MSAHVIHSRGLFRLAGKARDCATEQRSETEVNKTNKTKFVVAYYAIIFDMPVKLEINYSQKCQVCDAFTSAVHI